MFRIRARATESRQWNLQNANLKLTARKPSPIVHPNVTTTNMPRSLPVKYGTHFIEEAKAKNMDGLRVVLGNVSD